MTTWCVQTSFSIAARRRQERSTSSANCADLAPPCLQLVLVCRQLQRASASTFSPYAQARRTLTPPPSSLVHFPPSPSRPEQCTPGQCACASCHGGKDKNAQGCGCSSKDASGCVPFSSLARRRRLGLILAPPLLSRSQQGQVLVLVGVRLLVRRQLQVLELRQEGRGALERLDRLSRSTRRACRSLTSGCGCASALVGIRSVPFPLRLLRALSRVPLDGEKC